MIKAEKCVLNAGGCRQVNIVSHAKIQKQNTIKLSGEWLIWESMMWAEGKHKHLPRVMPPAATGIRTTKNIFVSLFIRNTKQVSSNAFGALVHILIDETLFAFRVIPAICNNHRIGAACNVLDVVLLVHRAKLKPNPLPIPTFPYIHTIFRSWCQKLTVLFADAYVMLNRYWMELSARSHEFKIYVCRECFYLCHYRNNILKTNEFYFFSNSFIFISHTPSIFFSCVLLLPVTATPTVDYINCSLLNCIKRFISLCLMFIFPHNAHLI